jgi:predicted nucleic acid-binding protein
MPFVLDASIAASWAFLEGDQNAELAIEMLLLDSAVSPGLWWYEVRNLLIMRERKSRRNPGDTEAFLGLLATLPVRLDHAPEQRTVLDLARTHELTVYDAAYLELAQREGIPLATLDSDLVRAARATGVPLIEHKKRKNGR